MLATEADVLRTLRTGTYTLHELYDLCEQRTGTGRDGGHNPAPARDGDNPWKHRLRGGRARARHHSPGNGYPRHHPRIVAGYQDGTPGEYEQPTHGWTQAAAAALRP